MSHDTAVVPLTDLCAICHINPIKYTCPRDGTHTCSLPCVKRHKQWAQCSGVRDPAEYRKRSELATPASIDKDFNFITKVERSLSRADDSVADKGIDLRPARLPRPRDARPKFEVEAESRGIKIVKAPKGLSRNKQNKTYWGVQPKCVMWTVEWLCQDGRRAMSVAPETKLIKELFHAATGLKRHGKKRKRPSDTTDEQSKSNEQVVGVQTKQNVISDDLSVQSPEERPPDPSEVDTGSKIGNNNRDLVPESDSFIQYFYLHRPLTESRFKCLIPISASASLQEVLNKKTLIEFPTIHVRDEPPENLSDPFITEDEYVSRHGIDIPITVSAPVQTTSAEGDLEEDGLEEGELVQADTILNLDESKVLEVLTKDLGS